jgi:hypothetical protein
VHQIIILQPTVSTTSLSICNNQLPLVWNGLTFTTAGSQTKTGLVNSIGCDSSATLNLTVGTAFSVNIGADKTICQYQVYTVDGTVTGLTGATYLWKSTTGYTSPNSIATLNSPGMYWLEVTNSGGCSIADTFELSVSAAPIDAEIFAATQIFKDDTVTIVNISKYPNANAVWNFFSNPNIEIIAHDKNYLNVVFKDTGVFKIGLTTYVGACTMQSIKTLNVFEKNYFQINPAITHASFIKKYTVFPNPSFGNFTISVELEEVSSIRLILFSLTNNQTVDSYVFDGLNSYQILYNLPISSGTYVLILETPKGTAVHKIIIN